MATLLPTTTLHDNNSDPYSLLQVPEAIEKCRGAGIVIRMVTGDNLITARSIAQKCGILSGEGEDEAILEGKTFSKLVHDENGEVSACFNILRTL